VGGKRRTTHTIEGLVSFFLSFLSLSLSFSISLSLSFPSHSFLSPLGIALGQREGREGKGRGTDNLSVISARFRYTILIRLLFL
jgi:hypothetical protein